MAEVLNTRELQKKVSDYQAGIAEDNTPDIPPVKKNTTSQQAQTQPAWRNIASGIMNKRNFTNIDTQEALEEGFGGSKYDTEFASGMDLEHNRALEQSGGRKILFGLGKGAVTAVTTAVNTIAALVAGAGQAAFETIADANNNGFHWGELVDEAANNWVSQKLVKLQQISEEIAPNYRTKYERSDEYQQQWWPHFLNANWLGDSFLKNFGFTVGAVGGGAIWSRVLGSWMKKRIADNIMKDAVLAGEGDKEALAQLKELSQAIRSGTFKTIDGEKVINNVKKIAERVNNMETRLQLYCAGLGAIAEGNVEGLMAEQEFLDDYNQTFQKEYKDEYESLEDQILATKDSKYVSTMKMIDANGKEVDVPYLNDNGKLLLEQKQKEVTEKYSKLQEYVRMQGRGLATTTMAINQLILLPSNLVQFGKLFGGGWKTSRKIVSGLKSNINAFGKEGRNVYSVKDNVFGRASILSIKNAASEGAEEILQGMTSSGAKEVAKYNLSSFNDLGYDDRSRHTLESWMYNFAKGAGDYIKDKANWQEGTLGVLTGLLGLPGRRWSGGAIEAIRTAKGEHKAALEAAAILNSKVNSKEFQDRWTNFIRGLAYDENQKDAMDKDNHYMWQNDESGKLISDVIAFADAGRLNDLNQIVDRFGNISASDTETIQSIKDLARNSDGSEGWTKDLSNEVIAEKVKDQAKEMKNVIKDYADIYDAFSARAPIGSSPEYIKELVATGMTIKERERRFMSLFDKVLGEIDGKLLAKSVIGEDGHILDPSSIEAKNKYDNYRASYEKVFGQLLPIKLPVIFENLQDAMFEDLLDWTKDTPEVNKDVQDLIKLSKSRQNYFYKLQTLNTREGQDQFEKQRMTPEKKEKKSLEEFNKNQVKGLKTLDDVKKAYNGKIDAKDQKEFVSMLESARKTNKHVDNFLKIKDVTDGLLAFLNKNGFVSINGAVTTDMVSGAIKDMLTKASSPNDIFKIAEDEKLVDDLITSYQDFMKAKNTYGSVSPRIYRDLKEAVVNLVKAYAKQRSTVNSGKTVANNPKVSQGQVSTPQGYDAAQPGSVTNPPTSLADKKVFNIDDARYIIILHSSTDTFSEDKENPDYKKTYDYLIANIRSMIPISGTLSEESMRKYGERIINIALNNPNLKISKFILDRVPGITASIQQKESSQAPESGGVRMMRKINISDADYSDEANDIVASSEPDFDQESDEVNEDDHMVTDEDGDDRMGFYQASVPEIAHIKGEEEAKKGLSVAADYRKAIEDLKNATTDEEIIDAQERLLSLKFELFYTYHPEYAETAGALEREGASKNINTRVKVKDKVFFQIKPTFPKDPVTGAPRILITMEDGSVLNILSEKTENKKYINLKQCREAIMEEYEEWKKTHNENKDIFTFSESSQVFAKPNGFVVYDRSKDKTTANKEIKSIPGYDKNAPIIYINRDGEVKDVNGKKLDGILDTNNLQKGGLYYLCKVSNGKYVPIRVTTRRFNSETQDSPISQIVKIKDIIEEMTYVVESTNDDNIEEQNKKIHKLAEKLRDYLDIHDVYFELNKFNNIVSDEERAKALEDGIDPKGIALRIVTGYKSRSDSEKGHSTFKRIDQMGGNSLLKFITSLNKPLALTEDPTTGNVKLSQDDLESYLLSNAICMHPLDTNIWFFPWNNETGSFEPATERQQEIEDEFNGEEDNVDMTDEEVEDIIDDEELNDLPEDYYVDNEFKESRREAEEKRKDEEAIKNSVVDVLRKSGINIITDEREGKRILKSIAENKTPNGYKPLVNSETEQYYGFVAPDGSIYIDPSAPAETPIHEYSHLWGDMYRRKNPSGWKSVVSLMKGTPIWDKIKDNYPELTDDNDIADEVLAFYSGSRGVRRIKEELNRMRDNGDLIGSKRMRSMKALNNLREALNKFWKGVADLLGIKFKSAEQVADKILSDLLNGVNPSQKRDNMTYEQRLQKKIDQNTMSMSDVRAEFSKYNTGVYAKERAALAEKVFSVAEKMGLNIHIVPSEMLPRGVQGRYSRTGRVEYSDAYLNSQRVQEEKKADLILHEMIHAVTSYAIDAYERGDKKLSDDMKKGIKMLYDIYDKVKNDERFKGTHVAKNVKEMVASLGNYEVRLNLKLRGFWDKLADAIRKLFGFETRDKVALAEDALDIALTAFDSSLYDKYVSGDYLTSEVDPVNQDLFESVTPSPIKMSELPEEVKKDLEKKGHTEQEFDSLPESLKDKIIKCAGII